jgi:hypothetical protein
MVEVSNNVLAGLLVVAILISLFGVVSMTMNIPIASFTGLAITSGKTNLTVQNNTCVQFQASWNLTDFGSGTPNTDPSPYLWITTETINTNGFRNGSESAGEGTLAYVMTIDNCGNAAINVSMNSTYNKSGFLGGNLSQAGFLAKAKANESNSCTGTLYGSWTDVNETGTGNLGSLRLCDNLLAADANDNLKIAYNLSIPNDVPSGTKSTTINLWAIGSS